MGVPFSFRWHRDRAVCVRCGAVLDDVEPMAKDPEYYHPVKFVDGTKNSCSNAGRSFDNRDLFEGEIEPFMRKRDRRAMKRSRKK